jgi:hypothetical protein
MPQDEDTHKRRIDMLMKLIDMYHDASSSFKRATSDGSEDIVEPVRRNRYGNAPQMMESLKDPYTILRNPAGRAILDPSGGAVSSTAGSHPMWNSSEDFRNKSEAWARRRWIDSLLRLGR